MGNDPFERGAAPRAVAARPPRPAPDAAFVAPGPPPGSSAVAPPAVARAQPAGRAEEVERKVEATLDGLEEQLGLLAQRLGMAGPGLELREALSRVLPRLRAGLGSALDLIRLLEPAERLDRFGMDARFAERFAPVSELLYAVWWRAAAHGVEAVPAEGPAIVVANHAGLVPWDALVLRHALWRDHPARRELRPLLDDRECGLPLIGSLAIRLGAIRASPEAASAILSGGGVVGVFPEGSAGARKPWRERYRLQRFGRGFLKLALRSGAPIVPCAILGSEETSPAIARTGWLAERLHVPLIGRGTALRFGPAGLVPLPARWTLRFGPPVPLDGQPAAAADDPRVVDALTERVRAGLQAMLDQGLAERRSVW